ncbi:MAG TPA: folylpolyglutamate synthase/dihydrofolate synthase family protein [Hyphomonadaceae bacterium]|nr:folylpolyglutamate synthase/dihydrofolate synthase family protein [Hyphomonadaceae bacterium]
MSDPERLEAELSRFRNQKARPQPSFGTAHIRKALVELGDPQDRMPPAIHITGTNGKGSTGAFIRAMAEAAGLSVHVFTSPHLVRVNERIRVASKLVEDEELADVLADIWDRTEDLTYFEALTAAAFCLFAHTRADLSVIEVGAGGATDATNVMARPVACVVTPISRDHEAMFGVSGVAAIARLKAGIFRENVPAIIAEQPRLALGVLREEARTAAAPVSLSGEDWRAAWDGEAFVYESSHLKVRSPWLGLQGRHQAENAGAACATLEAVGDPRISSAAMAAGLRETTWPARLQKLKRGPLVGDTDIWVDAAHNPGGAAVLAEAIRAAGPGGATDKIALIIAMQGAKDVQAILSELAPVVDEIIACDLPPSGGQEGGPGMPPDQLAGIARGLGAQAMTAHDFSGAIALARARGAGRIYVCGSLYLCGAILAANDQTIS